MGKLVLCTAFVILSASFTYWFETTVQDAMFVCIVILFSCMCLFVYMFIYLFAFFTCRCRENKFNMPYVAVCFLGMCVMLSSDIKGFPFCIIRTHLNLTTYYRTPTICDSSTNFICKSLRIRGIITFSS